MGVGWGEAGPASDGAVDIGGDPTTATDNVVVIVTHPQLVEGHTARRLDAPGYPGADQGGQHVVDGLGGHRPELLGDHGSDRLGFRVRSTPQGPQGRQAGPGNPQAGGPQNSHVAARVAGRIRAAFHLHKNRVTPNLESIQTEARGETAMGERPGPSHPDLSGLTGRNLRRVSTRSRCASCRPTRSPYSRIVRSHP
jgi:hypothetical protein